MNDNQDRITFILNNIFVFTCEQWERSRFLYRYDMCMMVCLWTKQKRTIFFLKSRILFCTFQTMYVARMHLSSVKAAIFILVPQVCICCILESRANYWLFVYCICGAVYDQDAYEN